MPRLVVSNFLIQSKQAAWDIERLRTIAQECGAEVGEGAMWDSIDMTGMTEAQISEYGRRLREEGLGI